MVYPVAQKNTFSMFCMDLTLYTGQVVTIKYGDALSVTAEKLWAEVQFAINFGEVEKILLCSINGDSNIREILHEWIRDNKN